MIHALLHVQNQTHVFFEEKKFEWRMVPSQLDLKGPPVTKLHLGLPSACVQVEIARAGKGVEGDWTDHRLDHIVVQNPEKVCGVGREMGAECLGKMANGWR